MRRLAVLLALAVSPAVAAPGDLACASRDAVVKILTERHGERLAWWGYAHEGRLMSMFVNAGTGTWTLLAVGPDGQACVRATGRGFEEWPQLKGEPT